MLLSKKVRVAVTDQRAIVGYCRCARAVARSCVVSMCILDYCW
ncbi:unnamed protein product [Amaranthus hypochondriacus]